MLLLAIWILHVNLMHSKFKILAVILNKYLLKINEGKCEEVTYKAECLCICFYTCCIAAIHPP